MFTHHIIRKNLKILAISFLLTLCIPAIAKISTNEPKFSVSIVGDYAQSKDEIQIQAKTFTFKTGSLGVRVAYHTDKLGQFFAIAGLGYSPSETATFAGASVSGPLQVRSHTLGFIYPYSFSNSDFGIDFRMSTTTNNHYGSNLTGLKSDRPVTASVDATSVFNRGSLGVNYRAMGDIILAAGIGAYDWKISATGDGSFDSSGIHFSTSVEASGRDQFHYLEASFPYNKSMMNIGLRRSNLNADNNTVLLEIYAGITIPMSLGSENK